MISKLLTIVSIGYAILYICVIVIFIAYVTEQYGSIFMMFFAVPEVIILWTLASILFGVTLTKIFKRDKSVAT